jgi:CubicO group peptidase (beta-lactamase class C family)
MFKTISAAFVALALALSFAAVAQAQVLSPLPPQPADTPWPTQGWPVAPLPSTVDPSEIASLLGEVLPDPHPVMGETRAVVVVQGGRIVLERYGPGFGAGTRQVSWSVAKSVTQALVGVAAAQGRLGLDEPMGHPAWSGRDRRAAITWRQWLQMVDGQRYQEANAPSLVTNDAVRMQFGPGRRDVAAFAARLPLAHAPGTHWNYNSAGKNLVANALTDRIAPGADAAARAQAMRAWMQESLFDRIGMTSAVPEFDAAGTFLGGSMVYATPRDFAKFGLLYLRDGMWDGQRILPPGWVDFARTPAAGSGADVYGAGWWLTPPTGAGVPDRSLIVDRDPYDAFSAQGHWGQVILVVPSRDLVIVRMGLMPDRADNSDWDALGDWLSRLARAFPPR